MTDETDRERHERLKERTAELKQEHDDLSLDRTPFDQADHDEHSEHLREHSAELKRHHEQLNRPEK